LCFFFGISVLLHVKRHSSGRTTFQGEDHREQRSPVAVVVTSSNGEGDRSVESLEVKVPGGVPFKIAFQQYRPKAAINAVR